MAGMNAMTKESMPKLLDSIASKRDRALVSLGMATGFRISELLSLTVGDVLGKVRITVQRKNMKRRMKSRTVPVKDSARKDVEAYLSTRPDADLREPLFLSRKGGAITRQQAHHIIKTACDAIEEGRHGTHTLRKTFAHRVHEVTKDIVMTAGALGHANINNTVAYLSTNTPAIEAAILGA